MINGIGPGSGRIDTPRTDAVQRGTAAPKIASVKSDQPQQAAAPSPAADLAAAGPPVDSEKVAAIRAAIADGSYIVDPRAIAEKMVDLDLPAKS